MAKTEFSDRAVPPFDESPSVILVCGDLDFFVEEAAEPAADLLATGGAEMLRFEDDAPPESDLGRPPQPVSLLTPAGGPDRRGATLRDRVAGRAS